MAKIGFGIAGVLFCIVALLFALARKTTLAGMFSCIGMMFVTLSMALARA